MTRTPDCDAHADDDTVELQIDDRMGALIETIAAELRLDPQELALKALRRGLVRHFEKN